MIGLAVLKTCLYTNYEYKARVQKHILCEYSAVHAVYEYSIMSHDPSTSTNTSTSTQLSSTSTRVSWSEYEYEYEYEY